MQERQLMKPSSEDRLISISRQRFKSRLPIFLIAVGLLIGIVGLYALNGWLRYLFLAAASACFVGSKWVSYMENAGTD
jgi:hypothetical protein